jgi:hypothetical protein
MVNQALEVLMLIQIQIWAHSNYFDTVHTVNKKRPRKANLTAKPKTAKLVMKTRSYTLGFLLCSVVDPDPALL